MSQPPSEPDPRRSLERVMWGCALGFGGLLLIWGADKLLPSSAAQELIALGGLLLIGGGGILVASGYFSLSIVRLIRFLHDRKP